MAELDDLESRLSQQQIPLRKPPSLAEKRPSDSVTVEPEIIKSSFETDDYDCGTEMVAQRRFGFRQRKDEYAAKAMQRLHSTIESFKPRVISEESIDLLKNGRRSL